MLAALPRDVARPGYDLREVGVGVVHLGPGAFHRVHQAWYADRLLHDDPRWGIAAVSLRSPTLRAALAPQDGLYTLAEVGAETRYRVIGALRECHVAADAPASTAARIAQAAIRAITLTVTEKGYCLGTDGRLDRHHPDIRHDLANPSTPTSVPGLLAAALWLRRTSGRPAPVILSCDNLADNGVRLRNAVCDFAALSTPGLEHWIAGEVAFPATMVDSITPATTDALREDVGKATGLADAWPVQREPFTQWIIEADPRLAGGPDWAASGAVVTGDVAGYEQAKLRLLNGAHSTLAYVGLLRGHATVAEAMADDELAAFVERLMREHIQPQVTAPAGLDVGGYITAVLDRFRNPALRHELAQIAWDGSQKLPFRLFGTIQRAIDRGAPLSMPAVPVAAWLRFLLQRAASDTPVTDPLAAPLLELARGGPADAESVVARFLGYGAVFPQALREHAGFRAALVAACRALPATPA